MKKLNVKKVVIAGTIIGICIIGIISYSFYNMNKQLLLTQEKNAKIQADLQKKTKDEEEAKTKYIKLFKTFTGNKLNGINTVKAYEKYMKNVKYTQNEISNDRVKVTLSGNFTIGKDTHTLSIPFEFNKKATGYDVPTEATIDNRPADELSLPYVRLRCFINYSQDYNVQLPKEMNEIPFIHFEKYANLVQKNIEKNKIYPAGYLEKDYNLVKTDQDAIEAVKQTKIFNTQNKQITFGELLANNLSDLSYKTIEKYGDSEVVIATGRFSRTGYIISFIINPVLNACEIYRVQSINIDDPNANINDMHTENVEEVFNRVLLRNIVPNNQGV